MDADGHSRLVVLIERATSKKHPALDASLLAEIKALCKLDEEHVLLAFDAAFSQLRATHAQVRLRLTALDRQATRCAGGMLTMRPCVPLRSWVAAGLQSSCFWASASSPGRPRASLGVTPARDPCAPPLIEQTRLLALLLCEQLFPRSRAFRLALLSRLNQVGAHAGVRLLPWRVASATQILQN